MKALLQFKSPAAMIGTLLIVVATGCGRDGIKVYHVDTNDTANAALPPVAASGAMPTTMPAGLPTPDNSGLPQLQYTVPAGWQQKAPSTMRVASFGISQAGKQADISVIPMGGMAGGNLANVNRWRGQVGLPAIDEAAVQKMTEKVAIAGQDADLFDIPGTGSERIIASVLNRDDTAWFFKITGDSALVEAQKTAFIAFLKSVTFGAPAATAPAGGMDMSQLPPSHPPIGGMDAGMPVTGADTSGLPTWTVPTGWQPAPLEQFLLAKFSIAGANGAQAAVNISSLGGAGGGLLPNINRWRGQLGLAPASDADVASLPTIDASGGKATVVDVSGTTGGKPTRLVGVVLPLGGQTWFYKLMGDADVVAQQKDALMKFVQSAKYSDAH